MPHFYATQLPLGFGGLILANFLCDAMQTLVSGVNSITAVATQDVLQHGQLARQSVASRFGSARMLTLALGGMTTCIALGVAWLANSREKHLRLDAQDIQHVSWAARRAVFDRHVPAAGHRPHGDAGGARRSGRLDRLELLEGDSQHPAGLAVCEPIL